MLVLEVGRVEVSKERERGKGERGRSARER